MDSDRSLVDGEFDELKHSNAKEALLVERSCSSIEKRRKMKSRRSKIRSNR